MEAEEYFEQGYEEQTLDRFKEAIKCYNKALKIDGTFEKAYIERAYCRLKLKDYNGTLADYKTAILLNPNNAVTYLNAGFTVYSIDCHTKDTFYLDKAIETDSDNMAEAYFLRGLIRGGNACLYRSAIEDMKKAIELGFPLKECFRRIADYYRCIDEFDKALLNYYKSLELSSENDYATASCYSNIGYIKHYFGLYKEAMVYYQKAKETCPDYDELDEYIELCEKSIEDLVER